MKHIFGHGPHHVVFIHGWFWDQHVFADVIGKLSAEVFTCATFDIGGYGTARQVQGPYTIAEVAHEAWRVAQALGWPSFSVLGHSMGGKAAQKLAVDHPEAVRAVIAVTPVSLAPLLFSAEDRAFFEEACRDDAVAAALVSASVGGRLGEAWLNDLIAKTRVAAASETRLAYMRSFVDDDFSTEARSLTAPILVVFGEHDQGVAERVMRPVYEELYSHVRFSTLLGVGHYPMLEAPEALAAVITDFLNPQ